MLEAEPLRLDSQRTEVVVIDMQSAFVSKGAMFDSSGQDVAESRVIIGPCWEAKRSSTGKKRKSHMCCAPPRSSFAWDWRSRLRVMAYPYVCICREHSEWADKSIISGTRGAQIAEKVKPRKDEIVIVKPKYSAFFGTDLDTVLKTSNVK